MNFYVLIFSSLLLSAISFASNSSSYDDSVDMDYSSDQENYDPNRTVPCEVTKKGHCINEQTEAITNISLDEECSQLLLLFSRLGKESYFCKKRDKRFLIDSDDLADTLMDKEGRLVNYKNRKIFLSAFLVPHYVYHLVKLIEKTQELTLSEWMDLVEPKVLGGHPYQSQQRLAWLEDKSECYIFGSNSQADNEIMTKLEFLANTLSELKEYGYHDDSIEIYDSFVSEKFTGIRASAQLIMKDIVKNLFLIDPLSSKFRCKAHFYLLNVLPR